MNPLKIATIGSYPRIGDDKDQQRYRRGMQNFQNKEISAHAFRDVEQSVIQEIIAEQISTGLDEITDGLISWIDPISHFTKKISNINTGGLRRYLDTNFYYRIPVITGAVKKKEPFVLNEFLYAKPLSSKPIKVVLTGPVTLAYHTQSTMKSSQKLESRVKIFTEFLSDEIIQLEKAGCTSIQIDEPSLGQHPESLPHVKKSIAAFRSVIKSAQLNLAVYYYPLAPLYDELSALPIDLLQLDFTTDGKRLWEHILKRDLQTSIGFGLLNARSTRLEPIDPILKMLRIWMESRRPPLCVLTPSSGLEFLPRHIALAKIKLLAKIRDESVMAYV